jgi:hypothetical protein
VVEKEHDLVVVMVHEKEVEKDLLMEVEKAMY